MMREILAWLINRSVYMILYILAQQGDKVRGKSKNQSESTWFHNFLQSIIYVIQNN